MSPKTSGSVTNGRLSSAILSLCLGVLLSVLGAAPARAQTVYSSLANPILPAAVLPPAVAPINGITDDYVTTLAGSATSFNLESLSFYGGVHFAGAGDGINNVLRFRFLGQFGEIPPSITDFTVAFPTSGDALYTIGVGANGIPAGSVIPTMGFMEITTLNRDAVGTWAFNNGPPEVGGKFQVNDVRAFSLQGRIPEPATAGLLALGVIATPIMLRRRR